MTNLLKKFMSAVLVAALIFTCSTGAFAASEQYVADVKIATGKTVEEAAQKLTEAGYTPINSDLNSGNGTAVVLGYTATYNADEAITDLAVMKEKGGYSFTEYEAMLEQQKTEVAELVDNLMAAVEEYRENCDAETGAALFAKDAMNLITNDDLDNRGMGDVFYDESTTTEQFRTAFLQGNLQVVASLGADLSIACFGSENFLVALADVDPDKVYPLSIDDDAEAFYDKLADFQKDMNNFADFGINDETSEEEFEAVFTQATEAEQMNITKLLPVYLTLHDVEYKGTTLYDFLMGDLDEMELSDLYPIIDCMTDGQRASMHYLTVAQIIQYSVTEDDAWADSYEEYDENYNLEKVSLFVNVDRSMYDASGVALTNDALLKQNADNDTSWTNGGVSTKLKTASLISLGIGIAAGITGAIALIVADSPVAYNAIADQMFAQTLKAHMSTYADDVAWVMAKDAVKVISGLGTALVLVSIAAILFYAAVKIYDIVKKSKAHPVYSEMPRILVDESIDAEENSVYTYYYCVTDTDGKNADLNAWNGSKWNGLYYTKDKNAGKPITVTNAVQMGKGNNLAPSAEYEGVHYFGESTAYNLNADSNYKKTVSDSNYTYLFFVHAKASNTASVFSGYGYYALAAFAGLLVGCGFTTIIANKKKKKVVTA